MPIDWNGLAYARSQMGISLAFHIVFAAAGVALPALMVIADITHRRTRDPEYLLLSKQLAKGTSILFAVGAVSGTVLSFELGLLWPRFMGKFGESIGLPFALEGFAFFTEAIFLGIYLYGRGKVSPGMHLASGIAVAVSGAASALFVTLVSAFMNGPGGTDPIAAMASPSWPYQVVHVLLSCYQATAWAMVAIAGVHPAAQPGANAAPQGAGAGAADGLPDRAGAAAVGRSFGQTPGGRAAAEAGRGGGAPAHRRGTRRCTWAAFPISRPASSTARFRSRAGCRSWRSVTSTRR